MTLSQVKLPLPQEDEFFLPKLFEALDKEDPALQSKATVDYWMAMKTDYDTYSHQFGWGVSSGAPNYIFDMSTELASR